MTQIELAAPLARTATGNGAAFDRTAFDLSGNLRLELECSAAAGTAPTLNVKLQDSFDGADWNDVAGGAFAQLAAAGRQAINVNAPLAQFIRVTWTITGSAGQSFTFDVKAADDE